MTSVVASLPGQPLGVLDHPRVRDTVAAAHLPLPSLLHAFLKVGLEPERLAEGCRARRLMPARSVSSRISSTWP